MGGGEGGTSETDSRRVPRLDYGVEMSSEREDELGMWQMRDQL